MTTKGFSIFTVLRRIYLSAVGLSVAYIIAVFVAMTPLIQTYVLYAHHIDFFGYNKFQHAEDYGLAPGRTVNMRLRSSDNITTGAWFMLSDRFYYSLSYPPPANGSATNDMIGAAVQSSPTILFLHGNTGTRALSLRVAVYSAFTSRLNSNVLAIDYRGFGDSEGHPTVEGVSRDARAAWDYLISHGARPENVLIVGHSLGTAIAGLLSAQLGQEGISPRGVVLMSPFSSVRTLIDEYYLFGFLPLLKPLTAVPLAPRLLTWSLVHRFDTLTLVPDIKASVLIAHAENDWDIPHTHSTVLFDAFLAPHLPPLEDLDVQPSHADNLTSDETEEVVTVASASHTNEAWKSLVSHLDIPKFGTLDQFAAGGRSVALLKTISGGHDIGKNEGVQITMGRMFNLL